MRGFLYDLRLALRLLRLSPGLSIAAIVTLALGIGANATIYSFADAVLYRPLAVADAGRLVHVFERREQPGTFPMPLADYPAYRGRTASVEAMAAHYSTAPLHAVIAGAAESLTGSVATASYFEVLQLRPAIGRFFEASEDQARDRDAVAVISHGLWQRRFGGDVGVLGSPLPLNGRVFTIVGVAPPRFAGVQARGAAVDVWIPAAMFGVGYRYCDAFAPDCAIVQLLARLRPGVSPEQAQREFDGVAKTIPPDTVNERKRTGVSVIAARGLGYAAESSERRQLNVFLGAVTLVLLIACANIAGLLLARATARRKHLAVRLAMGASRLRLVSHVLAESTVLAAFGGVAGLIAATWGTDLLATLYAADSSGRPLMFDLSLNLPVVLASFGLTLIAALLAGGIPAWHASRSDIITTLKDESASGGSRRAYLRQLLVSAQVAVSVVLLVGATLLVGSAERALRGPGFDPEPVITLRLRPSLVGYSRDRAQAFQREAIARLEALPGVISASPSVYMAIFSAGPRVRVANASQPGDTIDAIGNAVGPRYFSTVGVALAEGREFAEQDRTGAPRVAIVNDVLARRLAPHGPAAGLTVVADGEPLTVVGVVRDAQFYVSGDAPRPQLFTSYWQSRGDDPFLNDSRTFVKVAGDPAAMMADVQRAIAGVDAAVPVSEAHPLSHRVAYMFQPVRVALLLLTAFAGLAIVLCAVGLYGVLAFAVADRTREIGLRVAIGATRARIALLVLRDAMVVVLAGIAVGLPAAWYSTRFVASLLYGISPRDGSAFVAAALVILLVGGLASYLPARRAMRISALTALRID